MISSRSLNVGKDTRLFFILWSPFSTCAYQVYQDAGAKDRVAIHNRTDETLLLGDLSLRSQTRAFPPHSSCRSELDLSVEEVVSESAVIPNSLFHRDSDSWTRYRSHRRRQYTDYNAAHAEIYLESSAHFLQSPYTPTRRFGGIWSSSVPFVNMPAEWLSYPSRAVRIAESPWEAKRGNVDISTVETPSSSHLQLQAGVDDVVVQTSLQRRVSSDAGKVRRRGLQWQRWRLPRTPHDTRQVSLQHITAHMALQRLQQAETAAGFLSGRVRAVMKCRLHAGHQVSPREGGSTQ